MGRTDRCSVINCVFSREAIANFAFPYGFLFQVGSNFNGFVDCNKFTSFLRFHLEFTAIAAQLSSKDIAPLRFLLHCTVGGCAHGRIKQILGDQCIVSDLFA